jgi:hypothetical protein
LSSFLPSAAVGIIEMAVVKVVVAVIAVGSGNGGDGDGGGGWCDMHMMH